MVKRQVEKESPVALKVSSTKTSKGTVTDEKEATHVKIQRALKQE